MNTTRREINSFRNVGIFSAIGHALCERNIVFEYTPTGGNIWNIVVGNEDEAHIAITEDGAIFLYPEGCYGPYLILHQGLEEKDIEKPHPDTAWRVALEVAYTVKGVLHGGQISQEIYKDYADLRTGAAV